VVAGAVALNVTVTVAPGHSCEPAAPEFTLMGPPGRVPLAVQFWPATAPLHVLLLTIAVPVMEVSANPAGMLILAF
jgi:hypothetical protein